MASQLTRATIVKDGEIFCQLIVSIEPKDKPVIEQPKSTKKQ